MQESEHTEKYLERLSEMGFHVQRTTKHGKIIRVFTDKNRIEVLNEVLRVFPELVQNPKKCTELLIPTGGRIEIKPERRQGVLSPGVQNEIALLDEISSKLNARGGVELCFVDRDQRTFLCRGVQEAQRVGSDTKGKKKADILLRGVHDYRISLKMRNAEYWESSDSYAGKKARTIIDRLVSDSRIELFSLGSDRMRLSSEIAYPATLGETEEVVFGTDLGGGCVVVQDFFSGCLRKIRDSTYLVPVERLFLNPGQVYHDERDSVWFLIRNDRTRNSRSIGIPGIRVLATYRSRVVTRKNIVRLEEFS